MTVKAIITILSCQLLILAGCSLDLFGTATGDAAGDPDMTGDAADMDVGAGEDMDGGEGLPDMDEDGDMVGPDAGDGLEVDAIEEDAPEEDGLEAETGFCGNGLREGGEECDDEDFDGQTCEDFGLGEGPLQCTDGCRIDVSDCPPLCPDPCDEADDRRCRGTAQQVCMEDADLDCLRWMDDVDCADSSMVCEDSSGTPECIGGSGETCGEPLVLGDLPFSVSGGDMTDAFADDLDFGGEDCHDATGVEVIFVRYMEEGETVRVRNQGSINAVLRVLGECAADAPCLASRDEPEDPGLTFTAPADGNYYIVVEAVHSSPASKGFNITIDDPPPGQICTDPLMAGTLPISQAGGNFFDVYTNDHEFSGEGCTEASGSEVVFAREMSAGETVRLRESGSLNVVLRVLAECDDDAACLANRGEPEDPGLTFTAPEAGTYYFIVEAIHASPASKGFNITLEHPPAGQICTDPIMADTLPMSRAGGDFLDDLTNDHDFSGEGCSEAAGAEIVFARSMMAGETVRLRETGSLNAVLRVLSECDDAAACLADRGEPEDPGITFTAPADGVYYFVIEAISASPSSRGYNIVFEEAPDGNLCTDPVWVSDLPTSVSGGDIMDHFTDDYSFTGAGCSGASGVDVVFARDMLEGEAVRFLETNSVNVVLRVLASCESEAACLSDRGDPEYPGITFAAPAAGVYYFVAEAISASPAMKGYNIILEDPPEGNLCEDPVVVDFLPFSWSGGDFLDVYTNDYEFTGTDCDAAAGPEAIFTRHMADGESIQVSERGSLNATIRVLGACSEDAACLLSQESPEDPGPVFTAPAGGTYTFVVESASASPSMRGFDVYFSAP